MKKRGDVDVVVLLHNLTQLLAQERNKLPDGMEDQVCWYYKQFEFMLGFLTDNEKTVNGVDLGEEIAELAYRTENVVDTHYRRYKMVDQDEQPFVLKMDHMGNLKKDIKEIIERIGGLMSCTNSITSRFQYDSRREKAIQVLNQSLPRTTMGWVADPEADSIVDNTQYCGLLVDRLINGGPPDELDSIAIITSMELGMINLVKKVYNDALVSDHFDSRAWLSVGVGLEERKFLLSILNDIMVTTPKEIYEMEVWELKKEVLKQLINSRYLIVLESKRSYCMKLMEDVLPKNKKGSRIIIATDDWVEAVCFVPYKHPRNCCLGTLDNRESRECALFYLTDLKTEDLWKIFCKTIFGEKECPKELEHLGRRILQCCCRRHHTAVQIACILRLGEKTVSRWSNVIAKIVERSGHPKCDSMLTICYDEMPQHLKPCFLYLAMFPEETEIPVRQLIRLWIAEGLIQWGVEKENKNTQSRSIEDVAEEEYLEGLIGLNFIQVKNTRSDGGPKSCLIRRSEWTTYYHLWWVENFVHFYNDTRWWEGQPRRLCIQQSCKYLLSVSTIPTCIYDDILNNVIYYKDGKPWLSNIDDLDSNEKSDIIESELDSKIRFIFGRIRTLSCIDQDIKIVSEENWESFFKYTPLLRVLNLEEVEVGKLPKTIEKLFHLRYLSLKPANNIVVPRSIFNLWNLQTIDLRTTRFSELPEGIWKMQQLRHLYLSGDGPSRLPIPESEDYTLPNLQTLSFISIDPDDDIHISKRAPNLRKLGLYGYQCFSTSEQHVTFNLPHLQTLKFAGECNFEVPITLPDTITKISTVKGVHLQQKVIEMFGKLPNLQVLKLLQTSFDDGELVFGKGSFPQLQLLKFEASNIVTWRLEDRTMPNLHRLSIDNCPQLTEPPAELWKVNTLQEFDLSRASKKFSKKIDEHLKENEGLKLLVTFPLSSKSGT